MPACVSCRLYLLRDGLENLISRETFGLARCQNFPTHREYVIIPYLEPYFTVCRNGFFSVVLYFTCVRRLYCARKITGI